VATYGSADETEEGQEEEAAAAVAAAAVEGERLSGAFPRWNWRFRDAIPTCSRGAATRARCWAASRASLRESVSETRTRRALDTGALPRGVRVLLAWPLAVVVDVVVYATVAVVVLVAVVVVFVAAAW